MHKLIHTFTVLVLAAALCGCAQQAAPTPASPTASPPASATHLPPATVTPYPTPTQAPSITPLAQPTAQPSLTAFPPSGNISKPTPTTTQPTPLGPNSNYGCLNATLVKDITIPDGTEVTPGQALVKTWRFLNTGTCPWTGSTTMKFIKGTNMQPVPETTGSLVSVNAKADVSVSLVAPLIQGSYRAYFRLSDKDGNAFGPIVFVSITVTSSIPGITPLPTATP